MTSLEFVIFIIEWAIRLGALVVVPRGRPPSATSAWLLLIFFLPIPGLLLFLAIGSRHFPSWRTERFRSHLPFFERIAARLAVDAPNDGKGKATSAILSRALGFLPAVGGCGVELIEDYDAVIDRLVADIDLARKYVRISVYMFADDAVGTRVVDALGRAVARGVQCQVLIDAAGSRPWCDQVLQKLRGVGVGARIALPFRLWRDRTRRDMRNHRKLFVIDGKIGFAGSQNIVVKEFRPGIVNRELVARATGPIVAAMEAVVRSDWHLESAEAPEEIPEIPGRDGDACLQLLPSGANYRLAGFETLLVWKIHEARERVIIVTPYFIPDEAVLDAMRTAVIRGVEVDLVVSAVVDQKLVHFAQCSYYDDLMSAGVRIHLFRDFLLHAKNVSIDGNFAVIGSSNVDLRSFQLNEEASLLLHDADLAVRVTEIQEGYMRASDQLRLEHWRKRPFARTIAENIARLISPLL